MGKSSAGLFLELSLVANPCRLERCQPAQQERHPAVRPGPRHTVEVVRRQRGHWDREVVLVLEEHPRKEIDVSSRAMWAAFMFKKCSNERIHILRLVVVGPTGLAVGIAVALIDSAAGIALGTRYMPVVPVVTDTLPVAAHLVVAHIASAVTVALATAAADMVEVMRKVEVALEVDRRVTAVLADMALLLVVEAMPQARRDMRHLLRLLGELATGERICSWFVWREI